VAGGGAKFTKRCDGNPNDRLTGVGMGRVEAEGKVEDEVGPGTVFCP